MVLYVLKVYRILQAIRLNGTIGTSLNFHTPGLFKPRATVRFQISCFDFFVVEQQYEPSIKALSLRTIPPWLALMLSATGRALISPRTESRTTHLLTTPHSQHAPLNSSVSMSWHLSLVTSTALGSYCRILIHQSLKWPLNNANNTHLSFLWFQFLPQWDHSPPAGSRTFSPTQLLFGAVSFTTHGFGTRLDVQQWPSSQGPGGFWRSWSQGVLHPCTYPSLRHLLRISVRVRSLKTAPQWPIFIAIYKFALIECMFS